MSHDPTQTLDEYKGVVIRQIKGVLVTNQDASTFVHPSASPAVVLKSSCAAREFYVSLACSEGEADSYPIRVYKSDGTLYDIANATEGAAVAKAANKKWVTLNREAYDVIYDVEGVADTGELEADKTSVDTQSSTYLDG